ncbi:MAG: site-specific integrase [Candidatus Tectomicrobia bacterium]|nr:site-specific integrase [Candidatus Tectomicrobia bacterium]
MKGDGRVFQRGQIWWVAYYQDGLERRESTGSRERKVAVRLLRQRVGEIAAGASHRLAAFAPVGRKALTVGDVLDLTESDFRLNSRKSKSNAWCLKRLRRRFARYSVSSCTALAISHYMTDMQCEGRKPETINREIAVLRSAFRLAYRHDLVERVPSIKLLPQLAVRNEFFTSEEIQALLPCLPEHLRDVVLFGFLGGWRRGEITGLLWSNVNRSAGVIRLNPEQDKARTVRVLALEGELAALIERRWQARIAGETPAQHVFHKRGRPLGDFRETWLRACKRTGLGHRMFHSLRRSAARNMTLQGFPEKVIMSIMGHKTRVMFDRYNIVTESDQRAYTKRLSRPEHGQ